MDKRVGIVLHKFFYARFFNHYVDVLNSFTNIGYLKQNQISLFEALKKIKVLYSTYSFYLKEDEKDTYLFELINDKIKDIKADTNYNTLLVKAKTNFSSLTFKELMSLNKLHNKYLLEVMGVFGIFVNRFAKSDLFPKIAGMDDYEREIVWTSYEVFYENFYRLHYNLNTLIDEFNLLNFNEVYKFILIFFYGYNYYIFHETKEKVKVLLDKLISIYNDEEFLRTYYNLLQGRVNKQNLNKIEEYKNTFLEMFIEVNMLISEDLPKTNIFPKKIERVVVDETLI